MVNHLSTTSDAEQSQTADTARFKADAEAQQHLATSKTLAEVDAKDFDALFYPGGHGPLWDLAESQDSRALIESFNQQDKPIAAVCHAPAVFRHANNAEGKPLVSNHRVTGFSNSEEAAVGLTEVVPFLLEDMLKQNGGSYERADDWQSFVVEDGLLITGQNPASSAATAEALIKKLA